MDLTRAPGVPTIVNVWASWCGPCRTELPVISEFETQNNDRVRVLGVITSDVLDYALEFAQDSGADFPAAIDTNGDLLNELGIVGPPITLFIRADGSLAHVEQGEIASQSDLDDLVSEYLF